MPKSLIGLWNPSTDSAPGHADGSVYVSSAGGLEETQHGQTVVLHGPEATWWSRARIGSRGFLKKVAKILVARTADTTQRTADNTELTADAT